MIDKPDSDFRYRVVIGRYQATWHSMECRIGALAKRARRTKHTPESFRKALTAKFGFWPRFRYKEPRMAQCCIGRKAKEQDRAPVFTKQEAAKIFRKAQAAGLAAGNAAKPTAMVVGIGGPLGDEIDYTKRTYYVSEGVCGFAWVTIRPGNSSLARHARRLGIGGRADGGGVRIWVDEYNQSMERKEKHAHAFADVLREHGVEAYAQSRAGSARWIMGRLILQELLDLKAVEVLSEEDLDALFALAENKMRPPTLMAMKEGGKGSEG